MLLITVHPESVARAILDYVTLVLTIGEGPTATLRAFCEHVGEPTPHSPQIERLAAGDLLLWKRGASDTELVHAEPAKAEHQRHSRKYAEGNLGPELSFYFRGPHQQLNLRAQNLFAFLQTADGVDDATWDYHRLRHDYSRWLREGVKDADLGAVVHGIEQDRTLDPRQSRASIRELIEERYTLPAER
jgi:hypothetical protein